VYILKLALPLLSLPKALLRGAFLSLLTNGWREAWEALEGTFAGFLNDVEKVWNAIGKENKEAFGNGKLAPYLGREVQCALCWASVSSLARNSPPALVIELVKRKLWT
jgi:hypothetical protein